MEETLQPAKPLFSRRDLVRLIWPLAIEQALAVAVGLADSMMVASVGEAAVSGVSLVDMISVLMINIFASLTTGGAVVVSQFIGARDQKTARRACDQLVMATLAMALLITAGVLVFRQSLLRAAFGRVEPDVMQNCLTYMLITVPSYPFLALYNSAASIYRAQGNSRVSMKVSLLMNAINLGGNALLIYGVGMGVAGVAIPTLVSRATGAAVMMALMYRKDNPLRLSPPHRMRPDRRLILRILGIGIPSALEGGMFHFGKIVIVGMISGFGTAQISANAMSNNIHTVTILAGQAFSLAVVTVVGQCIGAQDLRQARQYAIRLTVTAMALMGLTCGVIWLLLPALIRLYNASPLTASYMRQVLTLNVICVPLLWAASFVLPCALRAANDARFTSTIAILSMCVFRVGFSYILGVRLNWGVVGVWVAMFLDWVIRDICYLTRFFSGAWKKHACFRPGANKT